jgi:hypothetical protein
MITTTHAFHNLPMRRDRPGPVTRAIGFTLTLAGAVYLVRLLAPLFVGTIAVLALISSQSEQLRINGRVHRNVLRERTDAIFQLAHEWDYDQAYHALDELEAELGHQVDILVFGQWTPLRTVLEREYGLRVGQGAG